MDELIDLAEAARRLNRKVGTLRGWASAGRLRVVKWRRAVRLYRWSEVSEYAAKQDADPMAQGVRAARARCDHEPTQAEVDAMVAEGYANLPDWWVDDSREMARKGPQLTIRVIPERVLFGRAAS